MGILVLLNYSMFLHKKLLENFFSFSLRDDLLQSSPFASFFSCWLFLDGHCLYLEILVAYGHFWWHDYIRIENKNACLYTALGIWKTRHSKLPLKISMATNSWKQESQQIFLITWVWSVVYSSKLENTTCKKSMGSAVCLL